MQRYKHIFLLTIIVLVFRKAVEPPVDDRAWDCYAKYAPFYSMPVVRVINRPKWKHNIIHICTIIILLPFGILQIYFYRGEISRIWTVNYKHFFFYGTLLSAVGSCRVYQLSTIEYNRPGSSGVAPQYEFLSMYSFLLWRLVQSYFRVNIFSSGGNPTNSYAFSSSVFSFHDWTKRNSWNIVDR